MSFNPHRIPKPKNFAEELEDLIEQSGSEARVVIVDARTRKVSLRGTYVDVLLARKVLIKAHILIE